MDSLNGACEFAKQDTSPFSTKKHMYGKGEMSDQATQHVSDEVIKRTLLCLMLYSLWLLHEAMGSKHQYIRIGLPHISSYPIMHYLILLILFLNSYVRSNKLSSVCMEKQSSGQKFCWFLVLNCESVGFLSSDGDAWQQRGHGRLPGESLGQLPDPGPASPTPHQPLHSRPEVLWSSVQ